MSNQPIIQEFNDLIIALKDADQGFHAAAQEVRDTQLRTRLHQFGQSSATLWAELQKEVRQLGGQPEDDGSFSGKCRRIWMEIKTAFTDKDETVVLKDCLTAHKSVENAFLDAVNRKEMPTHLKQLLNRQYEELRAMGKSIEDRHEYYSTIQTS